MLSLVILDNEGTPGDGAVGKITGTFFPDSTILRTVMYSFQGGTLVREDESSGDIQGLMATEVLLDIDLRTQSYPFLHSTVTGDEITIEPDDGYVVRFAAFINGLPVPGSYVPPAPIDDPGPAAGKNSPAGYGPLTGGMNQHGVIGIATANPGVDPNSWTLLDQEGAARTPQMAGQIGQSPETVNVLSADQMVVGEAHLADLAVGWVAV